MPERYEGTAKTSRPRVWGAIARPNIFRTLDDARKRSSVVSVVGPPGAGKTTAVAAWLESRGHPAVWYQMDEGDTDAATFFHYFGRTVRANGRGRGRVLPAPPQQDNDLSGFSRHFFRSAFACISPGTVLVFDNFHALADSGEIQRLIAAAALELPETMQLVIASRQGPPEAFARLIALERMTRIEWADLRFTPELSAQFLKRRHPELSGHATRLHELCGGWPAGLTLLAETWRPESHDVMEASDSLDTVFAYLAGEFFDHMRAEDQRILLGLSLAPRFTAAQATRMTGDAGAGRLLEVMCRAGLFVNRDGEHPAGYQFHSLLRAFLRHRVRHQLPETARMEVLRRTAATLESAHSEAVVSLYLENQDIDAARRAILAGASDLLEQGRWRSLAEQIGALPPAVVENDAGLLYWRGRSRPLDAIQAARTDFQRAVGIARSQRDALAAATICSAAIQTYELEHGSFVPLDCWLDALQAVFDECPFPDADSELRTLSALIIGMMHRRPEADRLPGYVERALLLQKGAKDVNTRFEAACHVLSWGCHAGDVGLALQAQEVILSLVTNPKVLPGHAAHGWAILSWHYCLTSDRARCLDAIAAVDRLSIDAGLAGTSRKIAASQGAWLEIYGGDVEAATTWVQRMEAIPGPVTPFETGCLAGLRSWIALLSDDPATALMHARLSVAHWDAAGSAFYRVAYRTPGIWARALSGDLAGAQRWVDELEALSSGMRSCRPRAVLLATRANLALLEGARAQASALFSDALRQAAREPRIHALKHHYRPWLEALCGVVLEDGVAVDQVRALVGQMKFPPRAGRPARWPWPVKIHCLGAFQILVDDQVVSFGRKLPKKPLALLKALIVMGGRDVPQQRVINAIWSGDSVEGAYPTSWLALHRLRKLLGRRDAIELQGGKFSLNRAVVWVDLFEFEEAADRAEDQTHGSDGFDALYRGALLDGEDDAAWLVAARERVRRKFTRYVTRRGQWLEAGGRLQEAYALYQRGLEADALNEGFYQGLIRCHFAQQRAAEAICVYRKLRQILSVTLGRVPSSATEELMRQWAASVEAQQ